MIKNIVVGLAIAVGVFIVVSQVTRGLFNSSLNTPKGLKEEVLSSTQPALQKALIVYQPGASSLTSTIAHQIAQGLNDGGYEVTLNHPGGYLSTDVSKYALLVFGSPVYSGQPSKVLTDYIAKLGGLGTKRVVLFSTGAFKYYMELDSMESALKSIRAYKKIKFFTGANNGSAMAYDLGKELVRE